MTNLVLDSSLTLAWAFEDEHTEEILALRNEAARGACVPALWWLEVANALLVSERKRRLVAGSKAMFLHGLLDLPIETDVATADRAWNTTLALAERYRLTVYDACYLELTVRRKLPLASLDDELRAAAGAENVVVLPAAGA